MDRTLKHLIGFLSQYNYQCSFESIYQEKDIQLYKNRKDAINDQVFLTIKSPDGFVIGRLYNISKESQILKKKDIERIILMFKEYQIEYSNAIRRHLEHLIKEITIE